MAHHRQEGGLGAAGFLGDALTLALLVGFPPQILDPLPVARTAFRGAALADIAHRGHLTWPSPRLISRESISTGNAAPSATSNSVSTG